MKTNRIFLALCFIATASMQNVFACDARIDALANAVMKKDNVPGIAIAVVNSNNAIEYCNYGDANQDKKTKMSQYTLFEIASVTKTFTATLAGIASAQNKFNLETSINRYVPELADNNNFNKITAQELLAHVAGMPSKIASTTKHDFFSELRNWQPITAPGTAYLYGNAGINLVGFAIENIYHQPYESILQEQLLNKVGMKFTFLNTPPQYQKLMAAEYDTENKLTPYADFGELTLAGGLKSNTYDLAKYLQLQINGSKDKTINNALQIIHENYYCLNQNTYQQLAWVYHTRQVLAEHYDVEAMIAAMKKGPEKLATNCSEDANGVIEKTGNVTGASSYVAYMPKQKIGVVVLMNKGLVSDDVNLGRAILKYKIQS